MHCPIAEYCPSPVNDFLLQHKNSKVRVRFLKLIKVNSDVKREIDEESRFCIQVHAN